MMLAATAACGRVEASGARRPSTLVYPPWQHTFGLHRVNQTHLDFYSGYRKTFAAPRGVAATKPYFNDKPSPRDDDELTVYGINSGTGEIFYNTSMLSLGFFGGLGDGDGEFTDAVGICADDSGNVFVADRGNDRIVKLRNVRNKLEYRDAFDLVDTGRPLRKPAGIALEDGVLFVADGGNDRVLMLDLDGTPVGDLGGEGVFESPFAVAALMSGAWNYYSTRFVVVTDSLNRRLTMLDPSGTVTATRRYRDVSGEPGGFDFVAIDYYGNVYVTDRVSGCIYKFDRHLRLLTRFGCGGDDDRNLVEPRGIAIYRRFGQVFVAEAAGASYFWVGTDVLNLTGTVRRDGDGLLVRLRLLLTEQSRVTMRLETDRGEVVKTLADEVFMEPGQLRPVYRVSGSNALCSRAKCTYRIVVTARATYSSGAFHVVERKAALRQE